MKALLPFSTHSSPSGAAVVRMAAASLPDARLGQPPGGERLAAGERHQISLLLRLAAEHRDVRGAEPVMGGHRERDARIDARELFDADAILDCVMPAPPYASGNCTPIKPSSAIFGSSSSGKCCALSHSITCGRISLSANSRTLRRSSSCSSVSRKCIP